MSYSKPLFIPWLREQIDSQRYPGVSWTNPEHTEFSLPWKHGLRQDSTDSDVGIFKAWAEVSGNGRALGDPSVWKRNFRSALCVKGFKMIADHKNDPANPHKIYRWPDETGATNKCRSSKTSTPANSSLSPDQPSPDLMKDFPLPTQDTTPQVDVYFTDDVFSDQPGHHDILQECMQELNICPEPASFVEPPPEQQRLVGAEAIGGSLLRGQPQYPVGYEGAGLPGQPAQPAEGAVGGAYDQQRVDQFLHTINQSHDGNHFKTEYRVKVFYRGKLVSEQLIQNESGLRIVFRPHLRGPAIDPDTGLSLVPLPVPNMADQTQASLTQRILDSLGCLDVGVSGSVIYGQRSGESRAYWSFSNFDQCRESQEVAKVPQQLYTLTQYIQGMLDFINEKRRESPHCSLFFCLGEKWPDPDNKPWNKKLITVEVVLTSMELMNQIAVQGGASSLQSVELQISLEQKMETD